MNNSLIVLYTHRESSCSLCDFEAHMAMEIQSKTRDPQSKDVKRLKQKQK